MSNVQSKPSEIELDILEAILSDENGHEWGFTYKFFANATGHTDYQLRKAMAALRERSLMYHFPFVDEDTGMPRGSGHGLVYRNIDEAEKMVADRGSGIVTGRIKRQREQDIAVRQIHSHMNGHDREAARKRLQEYADWYLTQGEKRDKIA